MDKESKEGGGKSEKGKYDRRALRWKAFFLGEGITILRVIFGGCSWIYTGVEFCSREV